VATAFSRNILMFFELASLLYKVLGMLDPAFWDGLIAQLLKILVTVSL
jgi:hypothetical protein